MNGNWMSVVHMCVGLRRSIHLRRGHCVGNGALKIKGGGRSSRPGANERVATDAVIIFSNHFSQQVNIMTSSSFD